MNHHSNHEVTKNEHKSELRNLLSGIKEKNYKDLYSIWHLDLESKQKKADIDWLYLEITADIE